jgi:hypothetical protein
LISQRTLAGWEVWWTRFSPKTSAQPPHPWWVTYMFVCRTDGFCLEVFLLHASQDVPIKGFGSPHTQGGLWLGQWPAQRTVAPRGPWGWRFMEDLWWFKEEPYPGSKEVFEAASSWEQ